MMYDDGFKLLGIIVVICLIVYFIMKSLNMNVSIVEGLENNESDINLSQNATIQSKIVMLEDQLVISKNKKEYETMIINMDDYINLTMLQQIVKTKFDSGIEETIRSLENLNTLKNAKDSLNVVMKYIDKR
jgi:hypothetical protein